MQKYVLSELDSGQRVITEHVESVRSVALGFWIGAGARDEPDAKAGITHFIEHLLFKGSQTYNAREVAEIFDGLGGELNAATSREHTVVYVRVADHHLEQGVDAQRAGERPGVAGRPGVPDGEPAHERAQHDARCPHAIAQHQARLPEPERLEDERRRSRQQERQGQERSQGWPIARSSAAAAKAP